MQIAVELGAASADHVTHTTDDDVDALAVGFDEVGVGFRFGLELFDDDVLGFGPAGAADLVDAAVRVAAVADDAGDLGGHACLPYRAFTL